MVLALAPHGYHAMRPEPSFGWLRTHLFAAIIATGIVLLSAFILLEFVRTTLLFSCAIAPSRSATIAELHQFCHQIPNRCYHVSGKALPLCARCLGINIGALLLPVFLFVFQRWQNIRVSSFLLTVASTDIILKFFNMDAPNWWRTIAGVALSAFIIYVLMVLFVSAHFINHHACGQSASRRVGHV